MDATTETGSPSSGLHHNRRTPKLSAQSDRCQCRACREFFNSTYAFDFHRIEAWASGRRCRDRGEMVSVGMRVNRAGFWVSGGRRVSTPWCSTSSRGLGRPLPTHGGPGDASAFAAGQEVRP